MTKLTISRAWNRLKYIPIIGSRREGFFIVDDELIHVDFRKKKIVGADASGFLLAGWSGIDRVRHTALFSHEPDITDCVFEISNGASSIRVLQTERNYYRFTVNHGEDLTDSFLLAESIVAMDVAEKIHVSIRCRGGHPQLISDPVTVEFEDPALRTLCQVLGVLVSWMALDLIHDEGSHT